MTEKQIQDEIWSRLPFRNFTISNFSPNNWWECDLCTISKSGYLTEYEIKMSKADFRSDFKKKCMGWGFTGIRGGINGKYKHELLSERNCVPKHFYFVIPEEIEESLDIPEYAGLITFGDRGNYIHLNTKKLAPKLSKSKACEGTITRMQCSLSDKYWRGRYKL